MITADQQLVARGGFDGAVRQDPGDYLYPVDANVAPASKLNLLTTRTLQLDVQIDDVGNARNTLDVTWDNRVEAPEWEPYRAMVNTGGRILGTYFRILVPERSRVEEVSGGTLSPVTNPAVVEDEAGPDRDRNVPQGPAWPDEPPGHVDEPVRCRRDQRNLPAHDPGAARHAAGSAHAHHPGARWATGSRRRARNSS